MDAPPRTGLSAPVSWWVVGGSVALVVGVLLLVVQTAALPELLASAPDAAVTMQAAWPMLGSLLLGAAGLGAVGFGRLRQREERLRAARIERMRRALRDPADAGVSRGVAGTRPPLR